MDDRRELWSDSPTKERAQVLLLDGPMDLQYGGRLPELQVSFEEWGEPAADGGNTVLVVHPMTADCHVTGAFADQDRGWWEDLIGPGCAIDTDRWHVVCPDLPGGCFGATGPRFPHPDDGAPWLDRFPLITPRDIVEAHRRFLRARGIERPAMVIGPSMGGMIAWEWAAARAADAVIVVAAPIVSTPLQIGWNWLQRMAADIDLEADGEASGKEGRRVGRGVGMLSYRSPEGLVEKFGRTWFKPPGSTLGDAGLFNVESWLRQHGNRIARRYDPWTWKVFCRTMDLHDLAEGRDSEDDALCGIDAPLLALGIRSDCLYPAADVRRAAARAAELGAPVTYAEIDSEHGHDAFLIDVDQIGERISAWLPGVGSSRAPGR